MKFKTIKIMLIICCFIGIILVGIVLTKKSSSDKLLFYENEILVCYDENKYNYDLPEDKAHFSIKISGKKYVVAFKKNLFLEVDYDK